jgi:hypothetical protein
MSGDPQRFIWADGAIGGTLHAVVEPQIATEQEAFCERPPSFRIWSRADRRALATQPKCSTCVLETRGLIDDTLNGIRWVETGVDADEEDEGEALDD